MNNLTTRRIILGLLMVLVLAFGVQGVVEAVSKPSLPNQSVADIAKFRTLNETFSISVGTLSFDDLNNLSEMVTITFSSGITPIGQLYGISLSGSGEGKLTEKGGRAAADADPPTSAVTAANGNQFTFSTSTGSVDISRTLTIKGRFSTVGRKTVTITGTDTDGTNEGPWGGDRTYIYHVANGESATVVSLENLINGYAVGDFGDADQQIYMGRNGNDLPVLYTPRNRLVMGHEDLGSERISVPSGPISGVFNVYLKRNTSTDLVTATVRGSNSSTVGVYIYGYPTLEVNGLTKSEKGGMDNPGKPGEVIQNAFTATVKDSSSRGVPGMVVKFEITSVGGGLIFGSRNSGTLVEVDNSLIRDTGTNEIITAGERDPQYVRTNSSGKASVNLRLGSSGKQEVTVSVVDTAGDLYRNLMKDVDAFVGSEAGQQVSVFRIVSVPDSPNSFDLFASVTNNGKKLKIGSVPTDDIDPTDELGANDYDIVFRTDDGTLTNTPDDDTDSAETPNTDLPEVIERPNEDSIAVVRFKWDGSSSNPQVTASLVETPGGVQTDAHTVTFDIDSGGTTRPPPRPPVQQIARLTITTSGTGTTRTVTVNAINAAGTLVTGVSAVLGSFDFTLSEAVTTGTATIITLPSTPGNYRLLAADPLGVYAQGSITVTLVAPAALGTLTITTVGASVNRQQTIQVTARKADGTVPGETFSVALTGAGISRTVDILPNGSGRAIITIPTTTTSYTLTVRADGYTRKQETFTTTGQRAEAPAPPSGPAGEADSVEIDGSRQRSGTVNEELDAPLRVRVVDANDNGVEDVRVVFRVLSPGRGTFPGARGSGRATQDETDQNGYVSVDFTPISTGNVTVRATPAGGIAPVTFIIDVGEAADDDDPEPPTPSRDVGPSREISPVVHLGMASRPPMLWVDGGAIYALVGADVQKFAPGVDNALNIVIGGGKVYWTEKTGESSGTINSANLDGTDVKELKSIKAVPMGIAVDVAGSKLYWTNSRGRIQSADLDGSGITNVIPGGLESPMDLALAGSNLYWTQGNGSVRLVNLTGQQVVRNVSTGTDTPGSVVVGGNKVYWTEMTGDSSGTVNSANLNGTDVKELKSIQAVPMGIAVDGSRSKLYWTNSRGRIQSANLDGSGITNVVSGLGSPGDMVLSNSITAPAAAPAETASGSKYDVNGDGTVDNADSDAVTVAIAAGATDAKYDVNGDGTVNVFDLVEIIANRDPGAAGAPTLFGMKMSAAQIDSLQEQIDLLIATNDRSPAAMRTLIYLQQLLVTARPEKTLLLANYPNPFNPETWIPYELATDTNVKVTIYNTQGVVIRSLQLGHQSAGYYMGRDRAAYWDGRNALGEQVASGLYFYQLETDAMSLMRKMVILK